MSRPPARSIKSVTFPGLTEMQERFVVAYAELGGRKGSAVTAAIQAGYGSGGKNRGAAKARAYEQLRNQAVLDALRSELTRRLNTGAVLGVQTLVDLCSNARSEQVRLAAARELVDRGYGPVISRNATIQATTSIEDLWDRLDARKKGGMADSDSGIVEGEFSDQS